MKNARCMVLIGDCLKKNIDNFIKGKYDSGVYMKYTCRISVLVDLINAEIDSENELINLKKEIEK